MTPVSSPKPPRARAISLAVVLWAFGLATTTLLVGVWGRSVANDSSTLTASALAALDPDTVAAQVAEWVASEAAGLPGVESTVTEIVIQGVSRSAASRVAIESIVTDVVEAASAPPGSSAVIDVAAAIEPLRPALIESMQAAGVEASPAEVDAFLRSIEGLVLTSAEQTATSGAISSARSALTTVMVAGAAGLVMFGTAAVRLSDDRSRMVRSLANRLMVSALTFALFLRIGAWAVDPGGGRSPLRESGAVLLSSNMAVLLGVASAGLAVSGLATFAIRRVRRSPARIEPRIEAPGDPVPAGHR
jgi:hypothetical protein